MVLSAGDRLGPYEVLSPLGEGGMGDVWKARDTRLNRLVALKVSKEEFSERFEREARAVASLNHPHICQLYDIGPNYLVMEYIDGAPILTKEKPGPLPLDRAIELGTQILDALDAAHKKGITHRDLKPQNILVTKQGVKLLDFGLAKQQVGPLKESDATVTQGLTRQGQILGTLHYMSPEQVQGEDVDVRSDLFSFGCVLYEMVSGRQAFPGENSAKVIAAILDAEPEALDVPPLLDHLLKTCLAKDPDQRFQTAYDLKRALAWAQEQPRPVKASAAEPGPSFGTKQAAIAAGIALAFGIGWAIAHFGTPAVGEDRVYRFELTPPEGSSIVLGASSGGIALSPDGKMLAYVAWQNGRPGLWTRTLDSASARLIPGSDGAYSPFWSPDSENLGFFAAGKLRRVGLNGDTPSVLCDVTSGRGGAWTSDGRIIFAQLASPLLQVPESGGTPAPFTKLQNEVSHYWPQVIPGGHLLYASQTSDPSAAGVYATSIQNPAERTRLLNTDTNALYASGHLLWARGSTLVAQDFDPNSLKITGEPRPIADPAGKSARTGRVNATVSGNGLLVYSPSDSTNVLSWMDASGKALGVAGEASQYVTFRISPDGRRVAASAGFPARSDLWIVDVPRGVSSRFTFDGKAASDPIWSPDGDTLVYKTGLGAQSAMYRKDSSGAQDAEQLTPPQVQTPTDWSRDGKYVLYQSTSPQTKQDILLLPVTPFGKVAAGSAPKPFLRGPSNEAEGQFSPEKTPHWVAYQSDESGRYEIYIQSFPDARGKYQISSGGGRFPKWGPDGRELYYISPDDKVMAVSLKAASDSVQPSAPRELFALPTGTINFIPYDVAADGRFLVQAPPENGSPLTVVVNWPGLLKK